MRAVWCLGERTHQNSIDKLRFTRIFPTKIGGKVYLVHDDTVAPSQHRGGVIEDDKFVWAVE